MNFSFCDLTFFPSSISTIGLNYDPNFPFNFGNMLRWYKADSFNLPDNSPVGVSGNPWVDNSVYGANLFSSNQSFFTTVSNNKFNGLPAIAWTGQATGTMLTGTKIMVTGDWTMFFLFSGQNTGISHDIYGGIPFLGTSNSNVIVGLDKQCSIGLLPAITFSQALFTSTPIDKLSFIAFTMSGSPTGGGNRFSSRTTYIDSSIENVKTLFGADIIFSGLYERIGRGPISVNRKFTGYFCELIMYSGGMSTGDHINFLTGYFRPKWGF